MFADLDTTETSLPDDDSNSSILDVLAGTPKSERLGVVSDRVRRIVAAVFDCAAADIAPDAILDDIGLDSMMAMDFRVRVNTTFSIDLSVLEILRGVSVDSLAVRVLEELESLHDGAADARPEPAGDADATDSADGVELALDQLSEAELRDLLAQLEAGNAERGPGAAPS